MVKVSVIIPNYNHARYLRQRIDSILNQTYRDFELIILDDCSADTSRAIIDQYAAGSESPAITRYYNSENSGSAFKQWDYGVNKAQGEFLWIAESDDFAEPDFLQKATAILNKNQEVGLVYCNATVLDERKKTTYLASAWKAKLDGGRWAGDYSNNGINEIAGHMFRNNTINNVSGVLFRKKKYLEAGCADHSMKYCGDWFLYIRILCISDIAYIAKPLNNLRLHSGSSCHSYYAKSSYLIEFLRVYSFILTRISLSFPKKLLMAKTLLTIILKKIIRGGSPGLSELFETFKFFISMIKIKR